METAEIVQARQMQALADAVLDLIDMAHPYTVEDRASEVASRLEGHRLALAVLFPPTVVHEDLPPPTDLTPENPEVVL